MPLNEVGAALDRLTPQFRPVTADLPAFGGDAEMESRSSRAKEAARIRAEVREESLRKSAAAAGKALDGAKAVGAAVLFGRKVEAEPAATAEETEAAFSRWSAGAPLPPREAPSQLEKDFFDWLVARRIRSAPSVAETESGRRRDEAGRRLDPRHWIGRFVSDPTRYSEAHHQDFLLFSKSRERARSRQSSGEVIASLATTIVGETLSGAYESVLSLPDAPQELVDSARAIREAQATLEAQRVRFVAGEINADALRTAEREAWEVQTENALRLSAGFPASRGVGRVLKGLSDEADRTIRDAGRDIFGDDDDDFGDFGDFGGAVPAGGPGAPLGRGPDLEIELSSSPQIVERLDDDPGRGAIAAPATLDAHPPRPTRDMSPERKAQRQRNQAAVRGKTLNEVVGGRPKPRTPLDASADRAFFRDIVPDHQKIPAAERMEKGLAFEGGPRTRFEHAFDSLSDADFDACWARPACRDAMKDRLRSPGGLHEHLMLEQTPHMRRNLDITAAEIRGLDTRTKTGDLHLKVPGTSGTVTHKQGSAGGEAWDVSQQYHDELGKAIKRSRTRAELIRNLHQLAEKWLPNGAADLPKGLGGLK